MKFLELSKRKNRCCCLYFFELVPENYNEQQKLKLKKYFVVLDYDFFYNYIFFEDYTPAKEYFDTIDFYIIQNLLYCKKYIHPDFKNLGDEYELEI